MIRGHVEFDVANLGGDFVIVRADGSPLYHFTVVVDDAAMGITDVIRGEDYLRTPKHILLFRALGHELPRFGHLPLILNPDRSKMSKRKSQTALSDYIAQGFIREALVNYLALLGWATGTEEEILALDEIVQRFDIAEVHKGGAVFDRERLEWLNGQWIRRLTADELIDRLRPFVAAEYEAGRIDRMPSDEELTTLLPVVRDRLPLGAIGELVGFLWVDRLVVDPEILVPKRWDAATTREALTAAAETIATIPAVVFEADELEPPLRSLAEVRGWKAGDLFMAIRVAVTGRTATHPCSTRLLPSAGSGRSNGCRQRSTSSSGRRQPLTGRERRVNEPRRCCAADGTHDPRRGRRADATRNGRRRARGGRLPRDRRGRRTRGADPLPRRQTRPRAARPDAAGAVRRRGVPDHPRGIRRPDRDAHGQGLGARQVVGLELGADDYVTKPFSLSCRPGSGPSSAAPSRPR